MHPTSRHSVGQIVMVGSVKIARSGYCEVVRTMAATKELVWRFEFASLFVV